MAGEHKIFLGSDHAGFSLKKTLFDLLKAEFPNWHLEDCGTYSEESTHYPDWAQVVSRKVISDSGRGILICGSGIGMSIAANKIKGIRAAQVWDVTSARLCREHNNANVICFGARLIGVEVAIDICKTWLNSEFLGGRHQLRIDGISRLEGAQL